MLQQYKYVLYVYRIIPVYSNTYFQHYAFVLKYIHLNSICEKWNQEPEFSDRYFIYFAMVDRLKDVEKAIYCLMLVMLIDKYNSEIAIS